MKIELVDLTCPKVLQIHETVKKYAKDGYYIILVGVEGHPEVIGTISFCGQNSILLTDKEQISDTIKKIEQSNVNKVLIIAQTTYNLKKFEEIAEEITEILGDRYKVEVKNTICMATKMRQEETERLSKDVDIMIIIGGKNSSNTKKIYDIARENCNEAILIETVNELDIEKIQKFKRIGIMAGASTPQESIEEVKKAISST